MRKFILDVSPNLQNQKTSCAGVGFSLHHIEDNCYKVRQYNNDNIEDTFHFTESELRCLYTLLTAETDE